MRLKAASAEQAFENTGTSFLVVHTSLACSLRYRFIFICANSKTPDEILQMDRSLARVHAMAIRFRNCLDAAENSYARRGNLHEQFTRRSTIGTFLTRMKFSTEVPIKVPSNSRNIERTCALYSEHVSRLGVG